MEMITTAMLIALAILGGAGLLGAASLTFGTDSRPGLGDDHAR